MTATVPTEAAIDAAVAELRPHLTRLPQNPIWPLVVEPQARVLERFQPLLSDAHIPHLTAEEIRPFFYFEHNHHWSGLHRQANRICGAIDAFRPLLLRLRDESAPIADRLDQVIGRITGLGKGIATALLLVMFPDRYGVWNSPSEAAMIRLSIFPEFARGTSIGRRYEAINAILLRLAEKLECDLWTLDALWFRLLGGGIDDQSSLPTPPVLVNPDEQIPVPMADASFRLERYLHQFLVENWDRTDLGRTWKIHEEPGEPEAGVEFPCQVGRIDILARHRTEPRWLVVELKRGLTSDAAVGQVLRYMGWVARHHAQPGDTVEGLVVGREPDQLLLYALAAAPNIRFHRYEVEFRLIPDALQPA
jgi:hypothetical protein